MVLLGLALSGLELAAAVDSAGATSSSGRAVVASAERMRGAAPPYRLALDSVRFIPRKAAPLSFRILDRAGEPVLTFDVERERRLHLIVVRQDMSTFQHLHPRLSTDGTWSITLALPAPGRYRMFADFQVKGKRTTLAGDLLASGAFERVPLPPPSTKATVAGYDVTLDSRPLRPGKQRAVRFRVARGGRPVTDLQGYLGALGHLVVLRASDLAYLHAHAALGGQEHEGHNEGSAGELSGPEILFLVDVPSSGIYRLFLQFRHSGRVYTVPFTVRIA